VALTPAGVLSVELLDQVDHPAGDAIETNLTLDQRRERKREGRGKVRCEKQTVRSIS